MDLERVRRAATLAFEGARVKDIGRVMRVDPKTLWRWQQHPVWAETTTKLAREVRQQVIPLAHQVLVRALLADLGYRGPRPNPKLALEVLDRFDPAVIRAQGNDGNGYRGAPLARWIVEYPVRDHGLESKPPTQVLLGPPAPPPQAAEPALPLGNQGKPMATTSRKRRLVVGPD